LGGEHGDGPQHSCNLIAEANGSATFSCNIPPIERSGNDDELEHGQHDIKARIQAALGSGRLTAWQRSFLTDMLAKHERYGARTRLTPKQNAALQRLMGDILLEPPPIASVRPSRPRSTPQPRSRPWRPHRPFRQARRVSSQFSLAAIFVVALFAMVGALFQGGGTSGGPAPSQSVISPSIATSPQISVIDGDTIRVAGHAQSVRLVGFNTPETRSARCSQERALGHQATARLQQLVANGTPSVEIVPCACKPGTHGTEACNFGRACGVLKVDGRDVGETLVDERLAARFKCGATSCPPLPRPWC
jgi:micrococcal nuclease